MAIQYYMRAFNTNLNQYVDWIVNDTPDSTGAFSGFPSNQLINITVNRVVQSKVANFLKPNQSRGGTDGYFFHVNSYDWINATAPGTGIPLTFTGFAVERGVNLVAAISNASNTSPINITTVTPHGLSTGQNVTIIGVTGNINANGSWPITVLGTFNFTLNGSAGSGPSNALTGNVFTPKDQSTLIWDEVSQIWRFVINSNGDGTTLGASQTVKVNNFLVDGYIALGSPTATQGIIRLPNNQYIDGYNSTTGFTQLIGLDTLNRIKLGSLSTDPVYVPGIIALDGYLEHTSAGVDGVTVAQSGFIRDQNNTTIVAFRAQNQLSDVVALSSNTFNNVIVGDATNASVFYNTVTGGIHQFQVNTVPQVEIGTSFLRFPGAVVLPVISQNSVANTNAQTLTLQASNVTSGTGTGGSLNITSGSGSGAANGVINLQTAGATRIIVSDNTETYNISNLTFAASVPSSTIAGVTNVGPNVTQTITTSTGQNMYIAAQSSSLGLGGNLYLDSGLGNTVANDGYTVLRAGGLSQLIVSAQNFPALHFPTSTGKVTVLGNLEVQGTLTTVDSTTVDIVGAVIHGNWSDPTVNPNVGIPLTVVGYSSHRGNQGGIPRDGASLIWTEGTTANNSTYGVTSVTGLYASDGYWRMISTPGDGFGVDTETAGNSLASVGVLANNFVASIDPNPILGTIPGTGGLRAPNNTSAVVSRNIPASTTLVVAGTTPLNLPQGTLTVAASGTNTFTTQGSLLVSTSAGPVFAVYTGTTGGNQFTGVTYPGLIGTPSISTGGTVGQVNNTTIIAAGSNNVQLPTGTINVNSTAGFPTSGTLRIVTFGGPATPGVPGNGGGVQTVTYTNIAGGTQFTGCAGGTGYMYTGDFVQLAPISGNVDIPLLGTDFANHVLHGMQDGYVPSGFGATNTGHIFNTATGGVYDFWVNNVSQIQLGNADFDADGYAETVQVSPTVVNPRIYQLVQPYTGTNNGFNMLVQAQAGQLQTGGANNNNGGTLTLASGPAGTGGGGTAGLAGLITLNVGSVNNSTFNNADPDADGYAEWCGIGQTLVNPRLFQQTQVGTGAAAGFNFKINAQAGQQQTGGNNNNNGGNLTLASGVPGTGGGGAAGTNGQIQFLWGSTLELTLTDGSLQWATPIATPPTFSQATTTGATGQTMTMQAQNAVTTGGQLNLSSGTGTTAGNVTLQTGAATRVLVTPTNTQFLDTATALTITPVSAGTTQITYAATDTAAQINQTQTASTPSAPMTIQSQVTTAASGVGGNLSLIAGNASGTTSTGGNLNLASGSGTTTNGVINFQPGGTTQVLITATGQTIQWVSTVATPVLNQATTGGASGQVLTVQAQNAATTGGNLALTSGTGGTTAGNVLLETGGTARVTVTPTNTQFADSATALTITPVSAGTTQITFASTDTAAQINQAATAGATGATMTVAAQNATTTGGNLFLTSGVATTDGYVALQTGGITVASAVPNKFAFNQGWRRHVTSVTGTYLVLATDDYLAITTNAAPFTITLPATPTTGDSYIVKDTIGSAAANNVTISGNGNNIDGAATAVLTQNYAAITVTFTGTQWSIS